MKTNWRSEISGGVAAAFSAIPVELVYGLLAVAPLGAAYANHGLRAALWACALSGLLGLVWRTTGGMITGSRPATALILSALATALLQLPEIGASADPGATVFVLLLSCTALAGIFLAAYGRLGVGRALKYVPYPVLAGLMCGIGLLMIQSALKPLLGMPATAAWRDLSTIWHPASLLVGLMTLVLCFQAHRLSRRLPGVLIAMLGGALIHHLLAWGLGPDAVGATASGTHGLIPEISIIHLPDGLAGSTLIAMIPTLLPYAAAIAAFAALESLLCLEAIESARQTRCDGDRELMHLGMTNFCAGLLGATPVVGSLSRVMVNLGQGAKSRLSGVSYSVTIGVMVVFAGPMSSLVPSAVTAAILLFYAQSMVDAGTRRMAVQVFSGRRKIPSAQYHVLFANFTVVVLVASVAAVGHMMQAMMVGIGAAVFLFVKSSMKPVIRQIVNGHQRRSLKVRGPAVLEQLDQHGDQIVIIEIDGPLFFGTADRASLEIEKASQHSSWVVLDLQRVKEIDPTGARILLRIGDMLARQNKRLLLCGMNDEVIEFLRLMGLHLPLHRENWFEDLDAALEAAENGLLDRLGLTRETKSIALTDTVLAEGLSSEQTRALGQYLIEHQHPRGICLFKKGDAGNSLFVARDGAVDILIPIGSGKMKRVASLAQGNVFGEMALLDHKARSADAVLQADSLVWELTQKDLDRLYAEHPEIAAQIMLNLSRVLAHRLRISTRELAAALAAG